MKEGAKEILEVHNGALLLKRTYEIECLTIYKADGECVLQIFDPRDGAIFQQFIQGLYLIVVNLKGGNYFTSIFRTN